MSLVRILQALPTRRPGPRCEAPTPPCASRAHSLHGLHRVTPPESVRWGFTRHSCWLATWMLDSDSSRLSRPARVGPGVQPRPLRVVHLGRSTCRAMSGRGDWSNSSPSPCASGAHNPHGPHSVAFSESVRWEFSCHSLFFGQEIWLAHTVSLCGNVASRWTAATPPLGGSLFMGNRLQHCTGVPRSSAPPP